MRRNWRSTSRRSALSRPSSGAGSNGRSWRLGRIIAACRPRLLWKRRSQSTRPIGGGRLRSAALVVAFFAVAAPRSQRLHGERALRFLSGADRRRLSWRSRLRSGRGGLRTALGSRRERFVLFALALPVADAFYRSSTGVPIVGSVANPTYTYRAARENPAAFAMWWFYYLNEWIRDDGIRGAIEKPDPREEAAVRPDPGQFGPHVRHRDPHQFGRLSRARDRSRQGRPLSHRGARRIRRPLDRPCTTARSLGRSGCRSCSPTHASCNRPVEVINAGTEAYTLEDNLERMRRDILPLETRSRPLDPWHERTARARPAPAGGAQRAGRSSARFRAFGPRRADHRARDPRLAHPRRRSGRRHRRRSPTPRCSKADTPRRTGS